MIEPFCIFSPSSSTKGCVHSKSTLLFEFIADAFAFNIAAGFTGAICVCSSTLKLSIIISPPFASFVFIFIAKQ